MLHILFDQNVPRQLRSSLSAYKVRTARQMGWDELENGELIAKAESSAFDVLVTCDQNIAYQQNLSARRVALVVLSTNRWDVIRGNPATVVAAVAAASIGSFSIVTFDLPPVPHRPTPARQP